MQIYPSTVIKRTLTVTASPTPPDGRSKTTAVQTLHTINNRQFAGQAAHINGLGACAHSKKAQTTHFQRIFTLPNVPLSQWNRAQAAMNLETLQALGPLRLAAFPANAPGFTRKTCRQKRHKHMQILFKETHPKSCMKRYSRLRNFFAY
jgi:hypothetical protein